MGDLLNVSPEEFKAMGFSNLYLAEQVYDVLTGKITNFERISNIADTVAQVDDFSLDEDSARLLRERALASDANETLPDSIQEELKKIDGFLDNSEKANQILGMQMLFSQGLNLVVRKTRVPSELTLKDFKESLSFFEGVDDYIQYVAKLGLEDQHTYSLFSDENLFPNLQQVILTLEDIYVNELGSNDEDNILKKMISNKRLYFPNVKNFSWRGPDKEHSDFFDMFNKSITKRITISPDKVQGLIESLNPNNIESFALNSVDSIQNLEEILITFSNLKTLKLENLGLDQIPEFIYSSKIDYLSITNNDFVSSGEFIKNTHITYLNLDDNNLYDLNESIGKLSNLGKLCINGNNLTQLPMSLSSLPKLSELFLGKNMFTEFPKVILDVPRITHIHLDENSIEHIPEDINKLKNLEFLSMRENNLKTLPKSLLEMSWLKELDLGDNPRTPATKKWIKNELKKFLPNTEIDSDNYLDKR